MIITVIALMIIASVPLTGGNLNRMSQVRFASPWIIMASLGVQLLVTVVLTDAPPSLLAGLHVASYLLAGLFLWRNRAVPGLLVIAAGGMANFAAISANAGLMPASPRALEVAGLAVEEGFKNSTAVEGARLAVLGDIFAVPAGLPLANVFSIGDVVLLTGVAIMVHQVARWPDASVPVGDTSPAADAGARS